MNIYTELFTLILPLCASGNYQIRVKMCYRNWNKFTIVDIVLYMSEGII
jgi:hypothetical protein